jgi:Uma2 family endonuclease
MAIVDPSTRPEEAEPVIIALTERVTEETLVTLGAKNPEYRFESTADGRLVVSPLTGTAASLGETELVRQIANWNAEHRLGFVTSSSGGVTLSDGAIKGPDAAFISHRRKATMPSGRKERRVFAQIAPDAVFELLSPSDQLRYTLSKCEEYVATGSDVAILLNPRDRSVTFYRPNRDPSRAPDTFAVMIGAEMPGFILDAEAVFDAGKDFS